MQIPRGKSPYAVVIRVLSVVTLIGLFAINIVGFIDTETGSAFGCGTQWPLCHGAIIPSVWGLHTIIEFMHRALVAVVTILLLGLAVTAWVAYRQWREVKVLILISVGFVFVQAALGAIGVVYGDPPAFLASHFGCSLLAFAGVVLLFIVLRKINRTMVEYERPMPLHSDAVDPRFRFWVWFSLVYIYLAMYVGAYISSVGAGDQFRGWPFPTESYSAAHAALYLDWLHRSIALGLVLLMLRLFFLARGMRKDRPDLMVASVWTVVFVLAQAVSGALLVFSHVSLWAFLLHVSIISFLFTALCYLGMQTLRASNPVKLTVSRPADLGHAKA